MAHTAREPETMPSLHVSAATPQLRWIAASIGLVLSLGACQPQSRAATDTATVPPTQSAPATVPAPSPPPAATPKPVPTSTPASTSIVISVGEQTAIAPDAQLRLLRVVSDSRCPKGAQCVWAGEVTLEFELIARDDKKRFELAQAHSPRMAMGSRQFELTGYSACPTGTGRKADAECATVAITTAALR